MSRESLIYAQIGPDGVKGAKSADGLPIPLGGEEGGKLYKHEITVTIGENKTYNFVVLSNSSDEFETLADMSEVIFISGSSDDYSDTHYVMAIAVNASGYFHSFEYNMNNDELDKAVASPDTEITTDVVSEW